MRSANLVFMLLTQYYTFAEEIAEEEYRKAIENPDLFEGDILRGPLNKERNAVVNEKSRWPNARIPYVIEGDLSEKEAALLQQAMDDYANKTCIRFVPREDDDDYIIIIKGNGCYSYVGRTSGNQTLSLSPNCYNLGIIIHELGHAVGFHHEHSRSDRDDYVNIHYENISPGYESNFKKRNPEENLLLTDFDFDSIMMYSDSTFSKGSGLKTITAKDGRIWDSVHNKTGLSESDVTRISKLYNC